MSDDLKVGAVEEIEVQEAQKTSEGSEENASWELGTKPNAGFEECESCSA